MEAQIKEATTFTSSIVSYPERCSLWGDGRYRGNCDGRLFLNLVRRYNAKRVADPMLGSGTTRDVIAWLNRNHGTAIDFWGGDLKDGFNLLKQDLPGVFDFIWIHPPYWDIVRYSDHPDDLSTCRMYGLFIERLGECLRRCVAALIPGGRIAVLIGDVRREGVYVPIGREVMFLASELGQLRSVIIKAQHNCRSDYTRYGRMEDVLIKHEYCIIFKKPPA